MTTPEFPDDSLEAMRRAADSVANTPGMRAALDAARQMAQLANNPAARVARDVAARANTPATRAARDAAAIGNAYQRHLQANVRLYQQLAAATALDEAQRAMVAQAVRFYGRTLRQQWAGTARIGLTFDITGLDRLLSDLATWRSLGEQGRTSVAQVLEEAYETAEGETPPADVPDEAVAGFEETALSFASSDADILPPKVMRAAFIWFCGSLVLLAAMQAAFTSDTTDAVLGKVLEYSPLAVAAMAAGRKAWDRYVGTPEDHDEEGESDET